MLLDSNIIIYAAQPRHAALRQFIAANVPAVSAVSYVEVLGFQGLTAPERTALEQFFAAARVLPLDQPVLDRAVALRQQRPHVPRRLAHRRDGPGPRTHPGHKECR